FRSRRCGSRCRSPNGRAPCGRPSARTRPWRAAVEQGRKRASGGARASISSWCVSGPGYANYGASPEPRPGVLRVGRAPRGSADSRSISRTAVAAPSPAAPPQTRPRRRSSSCAGSAAAATTRSTISAGDAASPAAPAAARPCGSRYRLVANSTTGLACRIASKIALLNDATTTSASAISSSSGPATTVGSRPDRPAAWGTGACAAAGCGLSRTSSAASHSARTYGSTSCRCVCASYCSPRKSTTGAEAGALRPARAPGPDHGRGWDDPAVLRQDVLEEAAPDAVAIDRVVGRRSEAVAHEPCRVSAELAVLEPDGRDAAASARDGQLE